MKDRSNMTRRLWGGHRRLSVRVAYTMFVVCAALLVIFDILGFPLLRVMRYSIMDVMTPVIGVLSRPVESASDAISEAQSLLKLRTENQQLKSENSRLRQWRQVGLWMQMENSALKDLMNYRVDRRAHYITTRVAANTGGAFLQNLVALAGSQDGVRRGLPVITGDGLVGRTTEVGQITSRILTLTDLNSRVPVIVGRDKLRAILKGRNSEMPELVYTGEAVGLSVGDEVFTSGRGGVFPTGLPVGIVAEILPQTIKVRLHVSSRDAQYVRILDYGLCGILPDPEQEDGACR